MESRVLDKRNLEAKFVLTITLLPVCVKFFFDRYVLIRRLGYPL